MPGWAYKTAMTAAAVIAWLVSSHLGMLAVIGYCWLTVVSGTNSAKAKADEQRIAGLIPGLAGRIGNLSAANTTTNGLANGTTGGTSASGALTDGTIAGTSGAASAGTAHTHGPGSFAVTNGMHTHGPGSFAVTDGTHHHTLPTV